ncbi:MAG: primosomal replication protein N [Rhodoferax sp.]
MGEQPPGASSNHLSIGAVVAELEALRYTPAGIPALNLRLEHSSTVHELGQMRQVSAVLRAKALGSLAERLAKQPIGSQWQFQGFLASAKGGRQLVFHIQEFIPQ